MSSTLKPIKVWGQSGPNPPKVAMVLEELGLPYEFSTMPFADVKKPEYLTINPNGRVPAIHDPNTGLTLWESGAIIEYLVEIYDKEHKISFAAGTHESFLTKQWLFFQTTGQGPYFGQAAWFAKFHHEQLPSAKERYNKEVNRVTDVLETFLGQQKEKHPGTDGPWLVGDKFSYADLCFVSWQQIIAMIIPKEEYDIENFPIVKEWMEKMLAKKTVGKVFAAAMAAMQKS